MIQKLPCYVKSLTRRMQTFKFYGLTIIQQFPSFHVLQFTDCTEQSLERAIVGPDSLELPHISATSMFVTTIT
jgi:hypothetical protein